MPVGFPRELESSWELCNGQVYTHTSANTKWLMADFTTCVQGAVQDQAETIADKILAKIPDA